MGWVFVVAVVEPLAPSQKGSDRESLKSRIALSRFDSSCGPISDFHLMICALLPHPENQMRLYAPSNLLQRTSCAGYQSCGVQKPLAVALPYVDLNWFCNESISRRTQGLKVGEEHTEHRDQEIESETQVYTILWEKQRYLNCDLDCRRCQPSNPQKQAAFGVCENHCLPDVALAENLWCSVG